MMSLPAEVILWQPLGELRIKVEGCFSLFVADGQCINRQPILSKFRKSTWISRDNGGVGEVEPRADRGSQ